MNLDLNNYIKQLLNEAAKMQNSNPADVNVCLRKWNEEIGDETQHLTREEVDGAISNFLTFIVFTNQFELGFFNGPIYTFGYRQLHAKRSLEGNENNSKYIFGDLNLSSDIINLRFSQLERLLKNDKNVIKSFEAAVANNQPEFSIGKFVKRDEDGNVVRLRDSDGNVIEGKNEMEEKFEKTSRAIEAKRTLDEKFRILTPFIEKLKDVKNYSISEIKFILDLYDKKINDRDIEVLESNDALLFKDLVPDDNKNEKVQNELFQQNRNLLFTTPDGKTKVYQIYKQTDGLRIGFFLHYVRNSMEKLLRSGIVENDTHEGMGSPWCVTQPDASQYISYREGGGASDKSYTYYFIVNEDLDFYHMTNDELAAKNPEWRKFSKLKYYINILCYQPQSMRREGYTRISPVNNGGEHTISWEELEQKFPGIGGVKNLLTNRPLDESLEKFKKDTRVGVSENPEASNFIGLQPISRKESFIIGTQVGNHWTRGVITKRETWRSFTPALKKSYCLTTDEGNYLNKFGSPELFFEIKSNPNDYTSFVSNVKFKLNEQGSPKANTFLIDIKTNILNNSYKREAFRVCNLNPNIRMLQLLNSDKFNLFNLETMDFYQKNGIEYDELYIKTGTFAITLEGRETDPTVFKVADKFGKSRGADDDDTFWTVYKRNETKGSIFFTNATMNKLLENGVLKTSERQPQLKIITDFSELDKFQDIK
jgi:hypothetical protein